jgi:transcriptional regulator with XRE-family HTH domain
MAGARNDGAIQRRHLDASRLSRQLREDAGLSLREVARRMGVSAMFLSGLERGNRYWSPENVSRWVRALAA